MENLPHLSSDEDDQHVDIFREPEDFYAPEKPATFIEHTVTTGQTLHLRLVGQSPLWGHLLWNAGKVIAQYLQDHPDLVKDRNVLELGAGAGLPSLVAALLGAQKVVVTDYPDADLIQNLQHNIEHNQSEILGQNIVAEGFLWGNSVEPLITHLAAGETAFDILILADILFNHSEHDKLVATVKVALKKGRRARALVFFTPYRPWLLQQDLKFFDKARDAGLVVHKLFEHTMDKVMFDKDPGDELLRRTVFAYEVHWPSS